MEIPALGSQPAGRRTWGLGLDSSSSGNPREHPDTREPSSCGAKQGTGSDVWEDRPCGSPTCPGVAELSFCTDYQPGARLTGWGWGAVWPWVPV